MNSHLENRIRDALTATATLADPAQHPASAAQRGDLVSSRGRRGRWLAPLAVAAAILLVVTAGVLARFGGSGTGPTQAPSNDPRFIVATYADAPSLTYTNQGAAVASVHQAAVVIDAATGRVTTTIPVPARTYASLVAVTPDPNVFYLLFQPYLGTPYPPAATVYRLTLTTVGHVGHLAKILSYQTAGNPALSPDGTRLAYPAPAPDPFAPRVQQIDILNLLTGRRTNFTSNQPGTPTALTWAPDSRHLLYGADGNGSSKLWILDTSRGHDLSASSPALLPKWGGRGTRVLTGDPAKAYTIEQQPKCLSLQEVNTSTGRQVRTLYRQCQRAPFPFGQGPLLTSNPSLTTLLVGSGKQLIKINPATGRATQLARLSLPTGTNLIDLAW